MKTTVTFIILILLTATLNSCCTCTLVGCVEGIYVDYQINDLTWSDANEFSLQWTVDGQTYDETTASLDKGTFDRDGKEGVQLIITERKFIRQRPKQIELVVLRNGVPLMQFTSFELNWESWVCNECRGGTWCKDQMAHTAHLEIDS